MKKLAFLLLAVVGLSLCGRTVMHRASVSHVLDDGTTVRMDLWYKEVAKGSGAYLYVKGSGGWREVEIYTWDWAHWVRTSLYRTPQGEIAAVPPFAGPPAYIFPLDDKPVKNWDYAAKDAKTWVYLGAFDWRPHIDRFDFIPSSEQAECIPMGGAEFNEQPRAEFQRNNCRYP